MLCGTNDMSPGPRRGLSTSFVHMTSSEHGLTGSLRNGHLPSRSREHLRRELIREALSLVIHMFDAFLRMPCWKFAFIMG